MDSEQENSIGESTSMVDEVDENQSTIEAPIETPKGKRVSWKIIVGIVVVVFIAISFGFFAFLNAGDKSTEPMTGDTVEEELENNVTEVVYYQKDERYFYEIELLGIVLENTVDEYGPYLLRPHELDLPDDRAIKMLEAGEIDIGFNSVNLEREEILLPIKVPLLRGLLGYRVFLIRDLLAPAFLEVETLDELTEFTAGFGAQWGDMPILRANNITVEGFAVYETIFEKLDAGEVDYFPRGISEAWVEVEKFKGEYPEIMVEENLAFYYPLLRYYFVNKENTELAERIEKGLTIAEEDGTFKELFLSYYGDDIERANLENREVFILENPDLLDREIDTSWWLDE